MRRLLDNRNLWVLCCLWPLLTMSLLASAPHNHDFSPASVTAPAHSAQIATPLSPAGEVFAAAVDDHHGERCVLCAWSHAATAWSHHTTASQSWRAAASPVIRPSVLAPQVLAGRFEARGPPRA